MLVALVCVLLPATAGAQVSVEVTPLRVELKMAAGGTYTQAVKLLNQGKEPVRVHARVDDWYLSKDGTPQFKLADPSVPYAAASWLRVNPVEIVAQPGVETVVRFTVTVPGGVAAAGYRTAIMFDLSPVGGEPVATRRGVAFRGRVATLVYVTIGVPKPAVELTDLQPRLAPGQPARVIATLKNSGRVHVRTKGQLLVYGPNGAVVRRIALPDVPVLPESEREVAVDLTDDQQHSPLAPGQYRVEVRFDLGMPEVLVGETTVTIGR